MEGLRCKEMNKYIKKFNKLLTKFTSIGGKRDDPSIERILLRKIPMQNRVYEYQIRPKTDVDQLLRYCQDINDRDFSFNNITKTTNSSPKRFKSSRSSRSQTLREMKEGS
eukprot:snap_masked-scaffold_67-processed-gene-0.65-mRNA-1 protein AED:1.00 eAED:1.00 QI:0/-1/0/0/-1/1/1/0/109